jgi:broad specificity phosphatase PhoE
MTLTFTDLHDDNQNYPPRRKRIECGWHHNAMEHHAIPLSDKGKLQAQLVADTLANKPSQILVSELIRTQQTAQPYCDRHSISYQINPLLNEIHAVSYELIEGMRGQQHRHFRSWHLV